MRTKQLDLKCVDGVQFLGFFSRLLDTLVYILDFRQNRHSRGNRSRPLGGAAQNVRAKHGPSANDSGRQGEGQNRAWAV